MNKNITEKQPDTCDTEKQKEITEKLTECDDEEGSDKDRSGCYEGVVQKEKNKGDNPCINS